MAAWVILIGLAVVVVGVVVKVGVDVARYLREDREAHGGRQTAVAAKRATLVIGLVAVLIVILIVWPLVLGDG
jgi:ABC-type Fe3+ transport system permease subunit